MSVTNSTDAALTSMTLSAQPSSSLGSVSSSLSSGMSSTQSATASLLANPSSSLSPSSTRATMDPRELEHITQTQQTASSINNVMTFFLFASQKEELTEGELKSLLPTLNAHLSSLSSSSQPQSQSLTSSLPSISIPVSSGSVSGSLSTGMNSTHSTATSLLMNPSSSLSPSSTRVTMDPRELQHITQTKQIAAQINTTMKNVLIQAGKEEFTEKEIGKMLPTLNTHLSSLSSSSQPQSQSQTSSSSMSSAPLP